MQVRLSFGQKLPKEILLHLFALKKRKKIENERYEIAPVTSDIINEDKSAILLLYHF